jgi:hypothetical protein
MLTKSVLPSGKLTACRLCGLDVGESVQPDPPGGQAHAQQTT